MTLASSSLRVTKVSLRSVRSYQQLELALTSDLTVVSGPNGVGKTNLLEAIATGLSGASPRTSSELRLIATDADAARIALTVSRASGEHTRDVVLSMRHGKRLRIDEQVVRSREAFMRDAQCVTFLPERLLIMRGAPQRRRALIDQLSVLLVPGSEQVQRSYQRALTQRNALLRRARPHLTPDAHLLPWTMQLVDYGEQLRAQRQATLEHLSGYFRERFDELTGLDGATICAHRRGATGDLASDLAATRNDEARRGSTLTGPHLDDIVIGHDTRNLTVQGSTGEQRAALLSVTLAAADALCERTHEMPVLLLDEPWAELDAERRQRLTRSMLERGHCIVTCTETPAHLARMTDAAQQVQVSLGHACTSELTPPAPEAH